ncbi:histidinol-phosphate transaminase [Halanaerobium praevalens]|uniref:Histidinol-phosphate aminotransferase n=1 Tax=Halanaerobium praevalens (strain ATCC 33744 / DSM 2228 / GSL) TaxID=572479 RepID=E3DRQ7_HALPG|nr:histidinol-phosphate transaminase [Halanaerobium praevalens]ADO78121.1 histidinol-phosphate aminotransferase [Halanaerobium praevalens DSM 2228]
MEKFIKRIPKEIKEIDRYQKGKSTAQVKEEYDLEKVVNLASNVNALGPAIQVIDTIQAEAKNVNAYPDSESSALKEGLAAKYDLAAEQVFLGNGSDEIIDLLLTLILEPGTEVIQADPTFVKYELAVKSRRGKSVKVPLTADYKHDLAAMEAQITDQTRAIFICNPNNPTGTMLQAEAIESFLSRIPDDILVIVDQAYQEYITDPEFFSGVDQLAKHSNLVLLRTFSKAYGLAGMRIGYALANSSLVSLLNKIRGPFNINILAQQAALTALESESYLKTCHDLNASQKEALYQKLEKLGLEYIQTESNFMMINLEKSDQEVYQKLLKKGVIISPGSQFGMENWIRVTIGTRADNEFFIRNLKKVLMN